MGAKRGEAFRDLAYFIQRAQVMSLFREALRLTRQSPGHARGELRAMIRQDIEANRSDATPEVAKYHLVEGRKRLRDLATMLGFATGNSGAAAAGSSATGQAAAAAATHARGGAAAPQPSAGAGHAHGDCKDPHCSH